MIKCTELDKMFLSGILKITTLLNIKNLFVEVITPDIAFEKIINIVIAKLMMTY